MGGKNPPELPDLKKKEKERKRAGAVWSGGRVPGTPWRGALGGNGASGATGAAGAARAAAVAAGGTPLTTIERLGLSALRQYLAALWATTAGKLILVGAALFALGGGLYLGARLMAAPPPPGEEPFLGGIFSNIVARPRYSPALEYLARVSRGQLRFDAPARPVPVKKEAPAAVAPAPAVPEVPWQEALAGRTVPQDLLPNNLSGAALTSSLGGQFGARNIFANPEAPKFGELVYDRARLQKFSAQRGKTQGLRRASAARRQTAATRSLRALSKRAMGQLKLASVLSTAGSQSTGETASRMASDAFEQRVTQPGGDAPLMPGEAPNTVAPIGSGAPDVTPPPNPGHTNATPYQQQLDGIGKQAVQAGQMKNMAIMLMILGAALIVLGIILNAMSFGTAGNALIIIGVLLIGIGLMMMLMSQMMKNQAKQAAQQLQNAYAQQSQNAHAQECVDQAYETAQAACSPTTQQPTFESTAGEDAIEEGNSTYEIEAGAPAASGPAAAPLPSAPKPR